MMLYKTVVIDFPWPIDRIGESRLHKSAAYIKKHRPCKRRPEILNVGFMNRYSTMALEDIRLFPIDDFADEEAFLFLWVTNSKAEKTPVLKVGFELLDLWGFKYHQLITWDKCNSFGFWTPIQGQTEHCLVAYRGNFPRLTNKQNAKMTNLIRTSRQNLHSQKPYEFYQLLRRWTPKPRIDLFARGAHEGFDGWGDEYVGEGPLAQYLEE